MTVVAFPAGIADRGQARANLAKAEEIERTIDQRPEEIRDTWRNVAAVYRLEAEHILSGSTGPNPIDFAALTAAPRG